MTERSRPLLSNMGARSEWVRLRTLTVLRWLAVTGQVLAVLFAHYVLELRLDLTLIGLAIAASVLLNLVSMTMFISTPRMTERTAMAILFFDLFQLVFLLYLTGGIDNPFSLLILAPVTISATALRLPSTLSLGLTALALTTLLIWFNIPLTFQNGEQLILPDLFRWGNWVALVVGIIFLAGYARRVTSEVFSMSQALAATQMALDREQKLTMIGGVVAAAAHEMGTPLATIKLVSSELTDELEDWPDLRDDINLINEQADRLSQILREMGQTGKEDLHVRTAPLPAVVSEAAAPHENRGCRINFLVQGEIQSTPLLASELPMIPRAPEIIHGLRNLVQNAVDFAESGVWIDARWSDTRIAVTVADDGPGFPPDLLVRIGDPFLPRRSHFPQNAEARPEYEGMGLGLFIAKTLLERSGATIEFTNASGEGMGAPQSDALKKATGAMVAVTWARDGLEVTKAISGQNPAMDI